MRIERNLITESTLEIFAEQHGLVLTVTERRINLRECQPSHAPNGLHRFYCAFRNVDIGRHGVLESTYGNGHTEAEAIADYARQISERHLVIDAGEPTRREVDAPRFVSVAARRDQDEPKG